MELLQLVTVARRPHALMRKICPADLDERLPGDRLDGSRKGCIVNCMVTSGNDQNAVVSVW